MKKYDFLNLLQKNIAPFVKESAVVLIFSVLIILTPVSVAASEAAYLKKMNRVYTINASMMENLNLLSGRRVTVFLDGGAILNGYIRSVGAELVHLEKTTLNDNFNALIRIKTIQAIEVESEIVSGNEKKSSD